jgi:hypothetical protein
MELPDEPTAAELADFLRSNDGSDEGLSFRPRWYEGMESWSKDEIRAVSDAAQHNTSIRELAIDVEELESVVANVVYQIIRRFHLLQRIHICDSRWSDPQAPMAPSNVVDTLLCGILASPSKVEKLSLYGCCSAHMVRDFNERLPNLKRLDIDRKRGEVFGEGDTEFDAFTVALALEMGKLSSLGTLWLHSDVGSDAFGAILSAAQKSTTLDAIGVSISNHSKSHACLRRNRRIFRSTFLFCANNVTQTVKKVLVHANPNEGFLDISSLFPVGGGHASFSPSIVNVQFFRCTAKSADRLWFDRAAAALTHVESLYLLQCQFSPLMLEILAKLTQLRTFYCISRVDALSWTHTLDDEFDGTPYVFGTNEALTTFCQVLERPDSLLDNVELELVSSDGTMQYPAIESLLRHSKGKLAVNFGKLPPVSSFHVVKGASCLSTRLKELRIRFCQCEFGDDDFASFLRAFETNASLEVLEFGFDASANLGTPEASIAAVRDLVEHNASLEDLALRGLGSEAVCALLERILPVLTKTNRSIQTLDFVGTDVADVWPRIRDPLLATLQMNGVLGQFGRADAHVPEDDREIQYLLDQNWYGRRFLLPRDAPVPRGLWATIIARIVKDDHHDVMYAFLRSKLVSLLHPPLDESVDLVLRAGVDAVGDVNRRGRVRKRSRSVG